jgi:hypothetical protein
VILNSDKAAKNHRFKDATSFLFQMATMKISNLDSDDSNLFSPLTAEEAENIKGGRLPSEPGSGTWRPPVPPPLVIITQPGNTTIIGPTNPLGG